MILTAGATPHTIGNNLEDFKTVKGHGETRIAAASGIHPVIIGLCEGLQGSQLNAGNFSAARRVTADRTLDWLWESVGASFEPLVAPQRNAQAHDRPPRHPVPARGRERRRRHPVIQANTIHTYIAAGFLPESVVAAVDANDRSLLAHSGLYSVQLQPAGAITEGKGSRRARRSDADQTRRQRSQRCRLGRRRSPARPRAPEPFADLTRDVLEPFTGGNSHEQPDADAMAAALPRKDLYRATFPAVEMRGDFGTETPPMLTGHFSVFNQPTEINSMREGNFMETIAPGAFSKTFAENREQHQGAVPAWPRPADRRQATRHDHRPPRRRHRRVLRGRDARHRVQP